MTDQTEEQTVVATAGGEEEDSTGTSTMKPEVVDDTTKKLDKMSISTSLSIWPPTQRTRDAVIKRLIQTLSEKSVLSDRYGALPADEANAVARRIEEEAFNVACNSPPPAAASGENDDGIEILQSYSKEISKRMLETVKSRSGGGKDVVTVAGGGDGDGDGAEERSVVETLT